jgi:predicted NBD/HSP70 family sugar kinase
MAFGINIDRRKTIKKNHIIDLFRQHSRLSKIQAKKLSGYSMDTTISIFNRLLREKLIVPGTGTQNPKGRKASFYRLNDEKYLYVGITFNQAGIYSSLVSFSNRVLDSLVTPLGGSLGREEFLRAFSLHLREFHDRHAARHAGIRRIGCAVPGDVDAETGILHTYSFIPSLKEVDIAGIIREVYPSHEVTLEHNIQSMTSFFLSGSDIVKSYRRVLFVSARSGAACGLIVNGEIVPAHGELGHVRVSDEKRQCICGRCGCLDLYFSHQAISRALVPAKMEPALAEAEGWGDGLLGMDEVAARYRAGDETVVRVMDQRLGYFASALLDVINTVNPDLVILSGELFSPFEDPVGKVTQRIREDFSDSGFVGNFRRARLLYMDLGAEIASIGICFLYIRKDWGYAALPLK